MPLYICNSKSNVLGADAKQSIAGDITNIHCQVTGAPAIFVHVAFFENSPIFPIDDRQVFVRGTIRKGRSQEQKEEIATAIRASLVRHGGFAEQDTETLVLETPASWVLEGGEIMPEPGEEAAWFAAHAAKHRLQEA